MLFINYLLLISYKQGRNHGWKVEGDQGLGPNTGALAPRARSKAELGVWCGRGSPSPAVRVRGYHPRKNFEYSYAKSCILWLFAAKFLAFWKLWPTSWVVAPTHTRSTRQIGIETEQSKPDKNSLRTYYNIKWEFLVSDELELFRIFEKLLAFTFNIIFPGFSNLLKTVYLELP